MSDSRTAEFEDAIARGGVVLFPSDTVYGLACDPDNVTAVRRLYALKGRAPDKPSALMYFDRDAALRALPQRGPRTTEALQRLLPGPVTVLLTGGVGLRVVDVPVLRGVRCAVLQSSANLSGGPDPCALADVTDSIRAGVDLEIDGGQLPGKPSSVIDLSEFEQTGQWRIVREGALSAAEVTGTLGLAR